jgi:hypothetical protein
MQCPQYGRDHCEEPQLCPFKEGMGDLYDDAICNCRESCRRQCEENL